MFISWPIGWIDKLYAQSIDLNKTLVLAIYFCVYLMNGWEILKSFNFWYLGT